MALPGGWPDRIGQLEQHTTTASGERNYHDLPVATPPSTGPGPSTGSNPFWVYAASHVQQLKEAQVPQVPQTFDAVAVRTWCGLALEALGRAREEIDAINVYPVADGDTGTNLYLTVESAAAAVEAVFAGHEAAATAEGAGAAGGSDVSLADAIRAMAHGALIEARGNSGTILAQLLRGMAQVLAAEGEAAHTDGRGLCLALRNAADSARGAVAHPVEGTVLTVASAAAEAACGAEGTAARSRSRPTRERAPRSPRPPGSSPSCGTPAWSTRAGEDWWRSSRRWSRRSRGRRRDRSPPPHPTSRWRGPFPAPRACPVRPAPGRRR